MSASAVRSPQAVVKPRPAISKMSARQKPASSTGPCGAYAASRESAAWLLRLRAVSAATSIRRPPTAHRTPADTTRSRSSAATPSGTTAPTSSSSKRASGPSVQPSVARQPAARTCTTSPVLAATPRFVQPTRFEPRGAWTNRTSSRMFHGSAYSQPRATTISQSSGRCSSTLTSVSSIAAVSVGVGITIDSRGTRTRSNVSDIASPPEPPRTPAPSRSRGGRRRARSPRTQNTLQANRSSSIQQPAPCPKARREPLGPPIRRPPAAAAAP